VIPEAVDASFAPPPRDRALALVRVLRFRPRRAVRPLRRPVRSAQDMHGLVARSRAAAEHTRDCVWCGRRISASSRASSTTRSCRTRRRAIAWCSGPRQRLGAGRALTPGPSACCTPALLEGFVSRRSSRSRRGRPSLACAPCGSRRWSAMSGPRRPGEARPLGDAGSSPTWRPAAPAEAPRGGQGAWPRSSRGTART